MTTFRIAMLALSCALIACAKSRAHDTGAVAAGAPPTANVGAKALAKLELVNPGDAVPGRIFSGTATFTATTVGIDVKISLAFCKTARNYALAIYEGTECSGSVLQGRVWDGTRGADITPLPCGGSSGWVYYSRPGTAAKPWSIGGPARSNVVGHVLVALDPDDMQPVVCGKIIADETSPALTPALDAAAAPSVEIRAHLAGLCVARMISRPPNPNCPNTEEYAECAGVHCELAACVGECADYIACLETAPDICSNTCPLSQTCASCRSLLQQCTFGQCANLVACSTPTPGGPCSELEACCAKQGNRAPQCLDGVRQAAKFGGDPTCVGLKFDSDFNTNLAYDPPCGFGSPDGGAQM